MRRRDMDDDDDDDKIGGSPHEVLGEGEMEEQQ